MADVKITNDQYKAGFIIYVTGKIAPPGPGSSVKAMSLVSSAMKNQKQSLGPHSGTLSACLPVISAAI